MILRTNNVSIVIVPFFKPIKYALSFVFLPIDMLVMKIYIDSNITDINWLVVFDIFIIKFIKVWMIAIITMYIVSFIAGFILFRYFILITC